MEGGPSKQAAFVSRLGRELGISLSVGAYSNYENGRRTVPAAVLIEAARIAGRSIDDLLSETGEPEMVEWVTVLGISQRMTEIERSLGLLTERGVGGQAGNVSPAANSVERELARQGALLAEVLAALDQAELWHPRSEAVADRSSRVEGQGSG
jgi:transcriptional regulator with XRE-family HTH domain